MARPVLGGIAPLFIVADVPASLAFYHDKLGFNVAFRGPSPEDEFFGIVRRDGAMIMFKALGVTVAGREVVVEPVPNYGRKPAFSWDAYVDVPDPDALAAEFASRGVQARSQPGAAPGSPDSLRYRVALDGAGGVVAGEKLVNGVAEPLEDYRAAIITSQARTLDETARALRQP